MPKCSFCDHPNPPGAERCEGCGAWVAQAERGEPDRDRLPEAGSPSDTAGHEDDLRGRVRSLLAEGRKIEAIKVYRRATGAGLKESKDAVESLDLPGGLPHPLGLGKDAELEPELLSLLGQGEDPGDQALPEEDRRRPEGGQGCRRDAGPAARTRPEGGRVCGLLDPGVGPMRGLGRRAPGPGLIEQAKENRASTTTPSPTPRT